MTGKISSASFCCFYKRCKYGKLNVCKKMRVNIFRKIWGRESRQLLSYNHPSTINICSVKKGALSLCVLVLLLSTKLFCGFILVIRISRTSRTDGHSHFSAHLNTYVNDDRTFQLRTGQYNLPNSRLSVISVGYVKAESKESRTVLIWKARKKMENSTWLAVNMKLRQGYLK